jgi:hypothetical protein
MLYGFEKNLEESKKELIRLKDTYGYDMVKTIEMHFNISDRDFIILHTDMPEQNLRNALEHYLDSEDYRGAEVVTKLLKMVTGESLTEVILGITVNNVKK